MPAETHTGALSRRLASLSPERRTALQRYLLKSASATSAAEEIPRQVRGGRRDFPLSSAQERMWFNHQWSPRQPIYNESFGLRITGELDGDRLLKSFDFVMACHEIFTVTFHSVDGQLLQRLGGCGAPRLELHDLGALSQSGREEAFETETSRLICEPFSLNTGPLFRAGLWNMGEGEHRLIFAMHHIIFDGWSGGQFFRELFTSYSALAASQTLQAPVERAQYVDFAVWERTHFDEDSANLDRQLEYWKNQLAGTLSAPRLPVVRQVTAHGAHRSGREVFVCPTETVEGIRAMAKESGATLFMVLLAGFNLLLSRYSGQDDIIVGLPTVNRTHSALSDIIGVFINLAIFRTDLSGNISFHELLGRVRSTALSAQANQEIPVERVIRALGLNGSAGRSLVNVLFDLQKKSQSLVDVPELDIQTLEVGNGFAKFDLVLSMEDTGEELKGVLEYDAEEFEPGAPRQFVQHFLTLMQSAVARPDCSIDRLPLLTSEEVDQLELRGRETLLQQGAWACVETSTRASEHPEALALASDTNQWSFGQLATAAGRLAAFLRSREVGPGQRVALVLPGGPELVVAQFAVMLTGAAFVPIDPADPRARVEFIVSDCQAALAITNARSSASCPVSVPSVCLDRDRFRIDACEASGTQTHIAGTDPAYLIYTSGSTGQPKGVVLSHQALSNLIAWHRRAFDISARDRATQLASVAFDASIWEIWPYLAAGASVHFPPRELMADAGALRQWIRKHRITVSFAPTPLSEELVALDWPANGTLRYLLTGGDRLRKRPPASLPFRFLNNYGPTENAVVATSGAVSPSLADRAPSIGLPIDNVWARVVDPNLDLIPAGVPGELLIGGSSLATGYWNRPSLTADKFVTLPDGRRAYRTGDLCRLTPDREIEFLGRIDDQVKLRGCRVELGEVENALLGHPAVRDAVADVPESAAGRRQLTAYYVTDRPELAPEELRTFLAERLPAYMVPSSFRSIAQVPRTANGKVDRKALPSAEPHAALNRVSAEPRTQTQQRLALLWKRILNLPSVMVSDDFFQAGGDSLLATRLAMAIRSEFDVEIPLAQMMNTPTIEALASWLESGAERATPLPPCVIQLKSGRGTLAPLFLAPPAAGSPACYTAFAGAFHTDRTVYGFEAAGLLHGKPIADIPSQARYYIQALQLVQPHGPYFIAGWSLGGPVAFEMACQLREAGSPVAYLGLLDAGLPENGCLPGGLSWTRPMWWALSFPFTQRIPLNYATFYMLAKWVGIRLPESWSAVWRGGVAGTVHFLGGFVSGGWRSLRVFLASIRSLKHYQPRAFDGTVTLFQTALHGDLRYRGDVLKQNLLQWSHAVEVYHAPGSHMSLMLDPHIASGFAPHFEATLNGTLSGTKETVGDTSHG